MKVLTVFAHPNPKSFCHAVLRQFTKGLEAAGHTSEVVDLYAIRFNPVFRTQDFASYVHESMPPDILDEMNLKQHVLDTAGGPIQRFVASLWLRDKDSQAVAKFIHAHRPKDVIAQWEKVKSAQVSRLYCAGLLVSLSCNHEGLVRASLCLRRCLRPDTGWVARGNERPGPAPAT
jgi:NAD(P)H dehydrogenase (quinone)